MRTDRKMTLSATFHGCHSQRGVVLATGLIFLLVITILGVSTVQNTSLEERMAGNLRERNLAFQSAEAALRDAEENIDAPATKLADFKTTCTGGLCDSQGNPQWANLLDDLASGSSSTKAYGGTAGLPLASRYVIEWLETDNNNPPVSKFLITVRAEGQNNNTVVLLQEVYKQTKGGSGGIGGEASSGSINDAPQ